jgi:hypothetical protein
MSAQLPQGFEALEPFAETWAGTTAAARAHLRETSRQADRTAFFEAAKDLVAPGLALLDAKPLGQFDSKEQRLMDLILTFAHVAPAVEVQGEDEFKHARDNPFLRITRAPSDA